MIGSVNGFHLQLQKFTLHFITSDLSAFHQTSDHFEWYKIEEAFSTPMRVTATVTPSSVKTSIKISNLVK